MSRPQEIRLSRYLADCGIWSRRKCENLITSGRITVDGCRTTDLSLKVAGSSSVRLDGKPVKPQTKIVLAVNKPPGYISTASDEFGRKTVMDLVKNVEGRLYPAGRLDRDSSGLIILTNDGELVYNITHPKFMIPKTYELLIRGTMSKKDLARLKNGITIDNKKLMPNKISIIKNTRSHELLRIQIHEGRKRILRRVFALLDYEVLDLKRVKIGGLGLENLKEGHYRILKKEDIEKLLIPVQDVTGYKLS